jgi:hypothetical protein
MKISTALSFLFGMSVFILMSMAISESTITTTNTIVQPALPKQVFTDWYSMSTSMTSDIIRYSKMGYVVKSVTANSQKSEYILVMEKY